MAHVTARMRDVGGRNKSTGLAGNGIYPLLNYVVVSLETALADVLLFRVFETGRQHGLKLSETQPDATDRTVSRNSLNNTCPGPDYSLVDTR